MTECPYCNRKVKINHDDGFGYEEGLHEMQCPKCGKNFIFETKLIFDFESQKADCLNGGEHNYELSNTTPREFSIMICKSCGKTRELTYKEREKYNISSKKEYFKNL